jgi:hypothetical protein
VSTAQAAAIVQPPSSTPITRGRKRVRSIAQGYGAHGRR